MVGLAAPGIADDHQELPKLLIEPYPLLDQMQYSIRKEPKTELAGVGGRTPRRADSLSERRKQVLDLKHVPVSDADLWAVSSRSCERSDQASNRLRSPDTRVKEFEPH